MVCLFLFQSSVEYKVRKTHSAKYAAKAADSEALLAVSDWLLAPYKSRVMAEMSVLSP